MDSLTSIPSIPEFFTGQNVFITGATGFMGKALIEKLLRSCPGIGVIYILMRPKRGKELQERLAVLCNNPLYERVKREQPNLKMEEKIVPLAGDITELGLGLNAENRKTLINNVNIIYHVAASVRFDDALKDAVILNIRGTREVCNLALQTKNLKAHIHVSTAFANCDRAEAKEILYPAKADWKKLIEIAENFDKFTLSALTQKYMDNMPNTYCFTKQIAEHVVYDLCKGKVPVKIFRPSIVVSSLRDEPVQGWIDNFNGPVGILVAYGKGIMRTIYAHDQYKPDYIPIDVVTKALIISTWDLVVRNNKTTPEIIQCTSHNTAEWLRPNVEKMATFGIKINEETPLNDIFWLPSTHTTTSTLICYIRTVFLMLIPAILTDGLLKLTGHKPILMKLQRKMYIAQLALRYFMNNEWVYTNDKLIDLQKRIKPSDKKSWDYEFKNYEFGMYVRQCILGCRRYLLKESDETIPKARVHYARMKKLHYIVQFLFYAFIGYVLWNTGVVYAGFQKIPI